jgi:hypothetical protein
MMLFPVMVAATGNSQYDKQFDYVHLLVWKVNVGFEWKSQVFAQRLIVHHGLPGTPTLFGANNISGSCIPVDCFDCATMMWVPC